VRLVDRTSGYNVVVLTDHIAPAEEEIVGKEIGRIVVVLPDHTALEVVVIVDWVTGRIGYGVGRTVHIHRIVVGCSSSLDLETARAVLFLSVLRLGDRAWVVEDYHNCSEKHCSPHSHLHSRHLRRRRMDSPLCASHVSTARNPRLPWRNVCHACNRGSELTGTVTYC